MDRMDSLEGIVHPRIVSEALPIFRAGFHAQAALEAMKQVELSLREKGGGSRKQPASRLVRQVFDSKRGFHLQLRLDPEEQEAGRMMFEGAFRYYRNYLAHDGRNVDAVIAARVLVLASELLDMLGASSYRLDGLEELERFVEAQFANREKFTRALKAIDGEWFGDDVVDGFFEALARVGVSDEQLAALVDSGLMQVEQTVVTDEHFTTITYFRLSQTGHEALERLDRSGASAS